MSLDLHLSVDDPSDEPDLDQATIDALADRRYAEAEADLWLGEDDRMRRLADWAGGDRD